MRVNQAVWQPDVGWGEGATGELGFDLVLAFGAPAALSRPDVWHDLRARFGDAPVLSCSTAGEIVQSSVLDQSLVATAIRFGQTRVRGAQVALPAADHSHAAGAEIARALASPDLRHVIVLSDGLIVNGTELVAGLQTGLPDGVSVSGGLAGDGARFQETRVGWVTPPETGRVAAVGLYGTALRVGCASLGGWDAFGPDRLVTRSRDNVLYELDGEPALSLYRRYLGPHAAGLPSSGLLFPLSLNHSGGRGVVRTVLSIREDDGAMVFAGEIPEHSYVRLMRANFDRLIDGAVGAASASYQALGDHKAELALLVSCVGRKLVLQQRIEEEIEGARDVLGSEPAFCGFYSYGEISPFTSSSRCELHNQTMTITTLAEADGDPGG